MTRIFISVLDPSGQHVPTGVVEVRDINAYTYPQHRRLLEKDAPTAVVLAPVHLNVLLNISVRMPAFPHANGQVLNLSHEILRKVAGPLHVIFRLPACSGPHMFSGPGRPPETYADVNAQITPAQPGPAPGIEVEEVEIPCRKVLFEVQDDGQLPTGPDHLFQLWQHDVDPLTDPIAVPRGRSVTVEVPRGSTTCNARVWRVDPLGTVIPGSEQRYEMWNSHTEGATLVIAPCSLPRRYEDLVPVAGALSGHYDDSITYYDRDIYCRQEGDHSTSYAVRAKCKLALEEAWAWLEREHPNAIHKRVLAFHDANSGTDFLASDRGHYYWGAFRYSQRDLLDVGMIAENVQITHVRVEYVE